MNKEYLFAQLSAAPILAAIISLRLGWRSRARPAQAKTALLLQFLPISTFALMCLIDNFGHLPLVAGAIVAMLFCSIFLGSVPWGFFYAWRARKSGVPEDKVTTTAALSIASFLLLPFAGLFCGVVLLLIKMISLKLG